MMMRGGGERGGERNMVMTRGGIYIAMGAAHVAVRMRQMMKKNVVEEEEDDGAGKKKNAHHATSNTTMIMITT